MRYESGRHGFRILYVGVGAKGPGKPQQISIKLEFALLSSPASNIQRLHAAQAAAMLWRICCTCTWLRDVRPARCMLPRHLHMSSESVNAKDALLLSGYSRETLRNSRMSLLLWRPCWLRAWTQGHAGSVGARCKLVVCEEGSSLVTRVEHGLELRPGLYTQRDCSS